MNIHPAIHMEQMKEEYEASASQLLLQGFYNKFQPGPGLKNEQLQWLLQQVVVLDEQRGKSQRIVAVQEGSVIGSMSIQLGIRSGKPVVGTTLKDLLPLWRGIRKVGWIKALGFTVRLACLSHRPVHGEMYIADLSVHELFRGAGVGKKMLEWVFSEAALRPGIQYISLHVSGSNVGAKRLYERMGFRTLEAVQSTFVGRRLLGEQEWYYMIREI